MPPGQAGKGSRVVEQRENQLVVADAFFLQHADQQVEPGLDARLRARVLLLLGQDRLVESGDDIARPLRRHPAHGVIADHVVAGRVVGRGDVREHPVVIAVLRLVDDEGEDFLAGGDVVPEVLEDAARHVGMAHDVVLRADQFTLIVSRDVAERAIGIGDDTLEVGLRDDDVARIEGPLDACRWQCRSRHGSFLSSSDHRIESRDNPIDIDQKLGIFRFAFPARGFH